MGLDEHTVTDLETTALDGLHHSPLVTERESAKVAVRELARRAEQAEANLVLANAVADSAETDRDGWKDAAEEASGVIRTLRVDRDRLRAVLHEVIDRLDHDGLGVVPHAAYIAARAALATPDTPPDAPTEGGDDA